MVSIIVYIIAGLGAGVGTGLAGLSAAAVISPMLITFCGFDAYEAVGIALASDVLASAVSAYTYGKNKNLDIKNGLVMLASVLCFTMVGSWVASLVPNTAMGGFSVFMTLLLGSTFVVRYGDQGETGGKIRKAEGDKLAAVRGRDRVYLRLCGRGRRNDAAAYSDKRSGI